MYLLTAINDKGEIVLFQISSEKTLDNIIHNLFSSKTGVNVTVVKMDQKNINDNFQISKDGKSMKLEWAQLPKISKNIKI